MAILPNNNFLLSSEGDLSANPMINPELLEVTANGKVKGSLPLPNLDGLNLRPNLVYEAMTVSSDGNWLFMAPEYSLIEDGEKGFIRLFKRSLIKNNQSKDSKDSKDKAYFYQLEKTNGVYHENGLVELIALSENELLGLERAFSFVSKKNTVRLFHIQLKNATDITNWKGLDSLGERKFEPVQKTLIADFDTFLPQFPSVERRLDNFEGMTLGPYLKDGSRLLVVASDNNFSNEQRTLFLFFKLYLGEGETPVSQ